MKFVNAKPVYFPPMQGNAKWANDNGNSQAWKTAAIRDKDGSLGAGPDSYVLINDGVNDSIAADAQACRDQAHLERRGVQGRCRTPDILPRPPTDLALVPPVPALVPAVLVPARGLARLRCRRPSWRTSCCRRSSSSRRWFGAGLLQPPSRSQPQWQGLHHRRGACNVRAGTEIKLTTERPTVNLSLTELDNGSWVIFQLPGFTTAASGTQQSSLDALRKASDTSYYKDKDALWVKVVSNGTGARSALVVEPPSRSAGKLILGRSSRLSHR